MQDSHQLKKKTSWHFCLVIIFVDAAHLVRQTARHTLVMAIHEVVVGLLKRGWKSNTASSY